MTIGQEKKQLGDFTIKEIKKRQNEMTEKILDLVDAFYKDTGIQVNGRIFNEWNGRGYGQGIELEYSNPIQSRTEIR